MFISCFLCSLHIFYFITIIDIVIITALLSFNLKILPRIFTLELFDIVQKATERFAIHFLCNLLQFICSITCTSNVRFINKCI